MRKTEQIKFIETKYNIKINETQKSGSGIKVTFERPTDDGNFCETWITIPRYRSYDDAFYLYFQDLEVAGHEQDEY